MIPAIPYSFGSITSFTISSPAPSKESPASRFNAHGRTRKSPPFLPRAIIPHSLGYTLLQRHKIVNCHSSRSKIQALAAVGSEVAVDESNPTIAEEPIAESEAATPVPKATNQGRRQRAPRKSEMPPVKTEDLLVGASFTGKVRSIQPFGAFVDFGAFTDGLVHVSNLSNGFVKDVASFVTVGQEVKVKILEVNKETGRISLTMRDGEESKSTRSTQRGDESSEPSSRPRSPRKNNQKRDGGNQKTSKFVKDQVLDGTVKNITRSGAYISLPEGEEGFLPNSEESEGISVMGSSSLQVGQEVNVRVLRVSRGQVTLTMKKEEDMAELNKLLNQGVVYAPRNPFELAFRKNKDIASYLDEREKAKQTPEPEPKPEPVVEETLDKVVEEEGSEVSASQVEESSVEAVVEEEEKEDVSAAAVTEDPASLEAAADIPAVEDTSLEAVVVEEIKEPETVAAETAPEEVVTEEPASTEASTDIPPVEDTSSEAVSEEKEPEPATAETVTKEQLTEEPATAVVSADVPSAEDSSSVAEEQKEPEPKPITAETVPEEQLAEEPATAEASADVPPAEDSSSEAVAEEEKKEAEPVAAVMPEAEILPEEQVTEEPASAETSPVEDTSTPPAASAISPALVKQLREESGAGMMECKKALEETKGDLVKAQEFLRKKGLASADKKSSRATAEGRIASYIHDNRIGVLVEVNCETDFVSRGNIFKDLVEDIAMQVAACPQVEYLSTDDVPDELINKEREIELQKEDLQSKPEQFRSKIVEGRMKKRIEELALLEQPYIKNDKVVIRDLVKQTIATVGENIKVKRFIRFNLGEGLEKKSQDFAAEVAAQTAAKPVTKKPVEEKSEVVEAPPAEEKPVVAISAALVKQLREETGAGMMECKKALAESGGDVVKAQEYLRKKGLSSADKKASRVAAEGRVGSYIHDSRIGVLIEVNCETDFVGRSENFKQLVDDLAMQVAACPQVKFVSLEDIPQEFIAKEKEIEMQREDLASKPENIREKIVEGRISKRLGETVLLEQPFIKDDSLLVKDLVKQTVAALGENIRVRRFARFTLGESSD